MVAHDRQDAHEALFELLVAQEVGSGRPTDAIRPGMRGTASPLSFPQQRLWFLHEMGISGNAYTIPMNLRLRGRLDPGVLGRALSEIVRRHEVLRTVFRYRDGEPEQHVLPPADVALPVTDLSALEQATRSQALDDAVNVHNAAPFDLSNGPILRAALLRLAPAESVILLAVHHVAFDGWSVARFIDELSVLYRSFRAGLPSPLPALGIQYGDFAAWQRSVLDGPAAQHSIEYWREQLADAVPVSFPQELARPAILGFRGGSCRFGLPPAVLDRLERLGRSRGATLFMTLLAGFALLLHRSSGETHIAIGSPIAGRDRAELEDLIGFFVNSVVMAVDLSGDPDFVTLLDRVRHIALDAFAHADVPFEKLVEELQPERGLDRNPLFQVMFAVQQPESMSPEFAFEGLAAIPIPFEQITARFDLELHVWPSGGALDGICTYNLDLFTRPAVERMLSHFAILLESIARDPYCMIGALPMIAASGMQTLLGGHPAHAEPPGRCLHQLLGEAVRQHPDELALVFGDTSLTFSELDRGANRIAHLLRRHGVVAGTLVSLCLDRSDRLIMAVLGVFKAGGCYLALDATEPPERLGFLLGDSRPQIHLTSERHAHLFAGVPGTVLALDALAALLATQPDIDPDVAVGPDDLAYIIYTSGSTGEPKGVEGRHGTIANLIAWHRRVHRPGAFRTLQYAQCSFDIFFQELFTAWLDGAACYMVTEPMRQDMEALASFIVRHRLERIFMPFTPLQYVIEILSHEGSTPFLRQVFAAGEQLQATAMLRDFFASNTQARLFNHYGPTECYVVCAHALEADPRSWPDLPPIGRPVDNVRIAIVDAFLSPVPVGIAGEILISGAQLSRGYRNRPAQTATSFIADPFGNDGARLYRSGDLGRRTSDGDIEFLGRMDRQIKIRGFRIEPGEIEVTLSRHPDVKQALVVTHNYGRLDSRLTAYVVQKAGGRASELALRGWLQARLPRQMIPNGFVMLDRIPLNRSGKIDRRALPAPEPAIAAEDGAIAARSAREQAIGEIFAELLHREHVGSHESFFDLGGHSLLAARVVSRLRSTLGIEFPLVRLFEAPTVAGIAAWIARNEGSVRTEQIPPATEISDAPASFAQRRLWLMDQLGTTGAAYLMPVNLKLSGTLDIAALERSLGTILLRHTALRTRIRMQDGQPVQDPAASEPFVLVLDDLRALERQPREDRFASMLHAANTSAFDLERGLPFRARLVRLEAEHHVLLCTFHHIACDGWSVMVFFRELGALYEAFHAGRRSPLPPLAIQYADYSAWQHRTLTPAVVAEHVAYWRPLLSGLVPLRLPTDRKRPATERFRGGGLRFTVPTSVTDGLRSLAQQGNATLYMVLLAANMALLHRMTGESRIAVGTPVANRDREEIEPLIGFFVNSLVMTADVRGSDSFRALLAQLRLTVLGAFAHQELPFETLVEALAPVRDLSRNPLFQVVFALQQPEAMASRLCLAGLDVEPLGQGEATVRFDLEFHLWLQDGTLHGLTTFDRDLFDADTIQALIDSYACLLQAVVRNPDGVVASLPLGSPATPPSPRTAARPGEGWLQHRIAALAASQPGTVAVVAGQASLTYDELEARSNRLARHLVSLDLAHGSHIAILMQRSTDLPMAMLAVLKAGCVQVPLEPAQPAARLRFVLTDTASPLIITDTMSRNSIPDGPARQLVLDGPDAAWSEELGTTLGFAVDPDEIAYIIYTSGSTGVPKGVQVTHANLARLFTATEPTFGFDSSDVWTCFHSAAFDFSVWEIWGALVHGGRLVMVTPGIARDPEAFLALLVRERVTVLNQTPTAFAQLADASLARYPALQLRWIIFGGEAIDTASLRRWFDKFGDTAPRLVNCYGITETTVHVTVRPLGIGDLDLPFSSPVGDAIPDLALHLLDADQAPVPDRFPGEIVISGAGVARGYLNAPALTASRFVPDPFGAPGSRMYRSGDHGRRRADGQIEYLGRIDTQVKLRGFRIETGEIIARLRAQPGIADAAVILRKPATPDAHLCAYLVPSAASSGSLRAPRSTAQTQDWQRVFDQQLERDWQGDDPLFRLTGWLSSYDRLPIPTSEMRTWADSAIAQISALRPRRVLEIGCGTGILLFRLAGHVTSYHGIDFSSASLEHVRRQIEANAPRFANVTIEQRTAEELAGLPQDAFDTIIINSVVQYFPDLDTLRAVLRQAMTLLQPDGVIYVGDIRDLRLAESFHLSVARANAPEHAELSGLLRRAREAAAAERELLIDPAFFLTVQSDLPELGAVALLSQRGTSVNELNKYRYAALLRRETAPASPQSLQADSLTEIDIAELLSVSGCSRLFCGLLNARLAEDLRLHQEACGENPTRSQVLEGLAPEALHRLGRRFGYAVAITPNLDDPHRMDAWFHPDQTPFIPWRATQSVGADRALASDPTRHQSLVETIPMIRRALMRWLPEYMVPSHFVVLDMLPRTGNAKLDINALPIPAAAESTADRQAPETESEKAIAAIFAELLGFRDYDVNDDFFMLGGHSLLATRLCARVRHQFSLELPLVRVFERPTIAGLAADLDAERLASDGAGMDAVGEGNRVSGEI